MFLKCPSLELRCSFCHKQQNQVAKLISSPSDIDCTYICNECVAVCESILEDEGCADPGGSPVDPSEEIPPLLSNPLASRLLSSVEQWIQEESLGSDAAEELAEVRDIAKHMLRATPPGTSVSTPR